jgi:hypothetical protein
MEVLDCANRNSPSTLLAAGFPEFDLRKNRPISAPRNADMRTARSLKLNNKPDIFFGFDYQRYELWGRIAMAVCRYPSGVTPVSFLKDRLNADLL